MKMHRDEQERTKEYNKNTEHYCKLQKTLYVTKQY